MSARLRSLAAVLGVAVLTALLLSATAGAAIVTLGSPLRAQFEANNCDEACSIAQASLPGATVTAPVAGTLIRWHILEGSPAGSYGLRVFGPLAGPSLLGAASSASVSPIGGGLETFSTSLPIAAGQSVGLDLGGGASQLGTAQTSGAAVLLAEPPVPDGATRPARRLEGPGEEFELAYNAELLPAPTTTAISPVSGTLRGGTAVTLTGTTLLEVRSVSFGGIPVPFASQSETQLTVTAPASLRATSIASSCV